MDINNGLGPLGQGTGKTGSRATSVDDARAEPKPKANSAERQDRVEISADAAQLRDVAAALESQESFDEARVAAIKSALEQGQYPVDSRRLAEKFLELESQIYQ